jgi:hypothetical protein
MWFAERRIGFLAVDSGRGLVAETVIAPTLLPREPCILLVPLQLFLLEGLHPRENLGPPILALLLLQPRLINPRLRGYQRVDQRRLAA